MNYQIIFFINLFFTKFCFKIKFNQTPNFIIFYLPKDYSLKEQ